MPCAHCSGNYFSHLRAGLIRPPSVANVTQLITGACAFRTNKAGLHDGRTGTLLWGVIRTWGSLHLGTVCVSSQIHVCSLVKPTSHTVNGSFLSMSLPLFSWECVCLGTVSPIMGGIQLLWRDVLLTPSVSPVNLHSPAQPRAGKGNERRNSRPRLAELFLSI